MKMRVTFPFMVKQVADNTVEFEARPSRPILNDGALESIAPGLSDAEIDRLADDITEYATGECIKRSLRVGVIHNA